MEINIKNYFKLFGINMLYLIINDVIFNVIYSAIKKIDNGLFFTITLLIYYCAFGFLYEFLFNYYGICNISYKYSLIIMTICLIIQYILWSISIDLNKNLFKKIKESLGKKISLGISNLFVLFFTNLVVLYSLKYLTDC